MDLEVGFFCQTISEVKNFLSCLAYSPESAMDKLLSSQVKRSSSMSTEQAPFLDEDHVIWLTALERNSKW